MKSFAPFSAGTTSVSSSAFTVKSSIASAGQRGRGAAPPQFCGGPTGYRLMLKRQRMGEAMCTPVQMEAVLGMLAASNPEAPPETWRSYREMLKEGFVSIDRRLQEYGPLEPERFSLDEANQRLAQREDLVRWRRA